MDRAYAVLDVKSVDLDARIIEGYATTPTTDRNGDVVDPSGAEFTLPMPLLWQHDVTQPIGEVTAATVTPAGIHITAKFATVDEPGTLRDRLDEAWQSVKARLVRGLSIGFKPIETKRRPTGGYDIKRWMWAECSAVTVPMNVAATITSIKSAVGDSPAPPRSATTMQQTYSEQIAAHEVTRSTALAAMADVMGNTDPGATLDAEQAAKYDSHAAKIKALDGHIGRLRELESLNVTVAQRVAQPLIQPAAALPSRPFVQVKSNVPPGTAFVRLACAKLMCKNNMYEAAEYAKRWDDSTPEVSLALKAAVAPGTVTDATWAAPLVNQNISNDFIGLLRQATVLGKIPNLREVPFNTKVPSQTAGGTYGWVGEAKPKPVTKLAFSTETLGISKVAAIIVLTQELIRLSNPKAEELVRADMIAGIAAFLDQQFLDPAVAAVAGINPASITNGAATATATTNPLADIMGLINHFVTNNISVDGLTFVMSPGNALALSFRTNLDGSPEFPGIGLSGGSYRGLTFITSGVAGGNVIAMQPQLILYADEGGVSIDASTEASLQMDSAPASPADATTVYVSLFQTNSVALRAERYANWKRIGVNSVKYLTGVAWPAPTGGVQQAPEPPTRGKA
jgi:HK97 family phage major capsid protein/HK97 family phage prohead protease